MSAPRIRVLPDHLVNQIAAGEVVERPASVVKELLENAVDAGATRCVVEIERAGLAMIRVTDNGRGMTPEEVVLAMERHATSKIASTEDLTAIRTLGFRGEALPSIASVSRLTIVTRTADSDCGATIEAGVSGPQPSACPVGTSVTVRDLFHNVPARLKFQKGERSQVVAIEDVVSRLALSVPSLHLTLTSGLRTLMDLLPCTRLVDRAVAVFGRDTAGHLFDCSAEHTGVRVTGVVSDPTCTRQDPGRLVFLVNDRPVADIGLRRALLLAYSVLLPPGRFPAACLRIQVDPSDVDVNVHPQKTEVRFRSAREVASTLFDAVQATVTSTPWVKTAAESTPDRPAPALGMVRDSPPTLWLVQEPAVEQAQRTVPRFSAMRFIGQVAGTVLVLEGPDTFVLVDQHAAFERVNFDRLWRDLEAGQVTRDALLFPEIVNLVAAEMARFEEDHALLEKAGFDLERYSGDALAVRAVPALLRGRGAAEVVAECLGSTSDDALGPGSPRLRKIAATVACHASVRAGDPVSESDVRWLLAAMDRIDLAAYCPHGRQAVVVYPMATVLRWFGR